MLYGIRDFFCLKLKQKHLSLIHVNIQTCGFVLSVLQPFRSFTLKNHML